MTGKLQNRKAWLIGGAMATLLLVAISWLALIKPSLDEASSVREQAAAASDQNAQLASANGKLGRKYPLVPAMQKQLEGLLAAVPGTPSLPEFTREINSRAKAHHVSLQNLAITAPAAVAAASGMTTGAAGGGTPSDSTNGQASPAPTSPAVPTASQLQIAVSFSAKGPVKSLTSFISAMQYGRRSLLVTASTLGLDTRAATMNVQAYVYTAPMTPDQLRQTRALLTSIK